ncbi:TAXI family TRAP transporter solute-binding subunit [Methylobacterium radiodurans]|uniref:C4-dicarboxylate ABC transporter substrate-binding protein n=1 Tax=Methylobacterium radiodurans TaxID=2202828 RepID=A0A2U8VQS2_9HYPH|nr:TAXI family TRAP transporter solute-binding subunit [Methylobacterium radiodurans]AWN35662.1 C4-dicarboxylate ABC transporter substrate-binding protein [Methylobacterium radiodurans]
MRCAVRFLLTLLLLAGAARAGELRLSLGTATPGGGFPAYAEALVGAMRTVDPGLVIETRPTGGSVENLDLLRRGALDLALVQGAYAYPALAGSDTPRLGVIAAMYPTPGLFVLPPGSPVRQVADLRGRPVALGTRDSGLTAMGRAVLVASGLDPERDVEPVLLARAGDGPDLVRAGKVAALWGGGLRWPGFMALAGDPGGARFLAPTPEAVARLVAEQPELRRMRVPAGTFPGQAEPIDTVGSWSLILGRADLPPEAAERVVRAMDGARDVLARATGQGTGSDPRNLAEAVPPAWLNPGTRRALADLARTP